jgi:hypothetical protein
MRRIAVILGAVALGAVPLTVAAQGSYKAPRTSWGKADISGYWTNESLTRLERDTKFGERRAYTKEEAAAIERSTDERNARLDAPTDLKAVENWTSRSGPDTADECQSGSTGAACGYNAGWTSPGNRLARVGGEPRTSYITFPANGRVPPALPGAAQRARRLPSNDEGEGSDPGPGAGRAAAPPAARGGAISRQNDNPETRSLGERCIMSFGSSSGPIMQSQLYNNNYEFVLTKDHLAIWVEMVHDVRIIPIGGKHRTDGVRPYMGDSIAWWEGDTLVVETINYHPNQNFRGASEDLKVTEKFTRVGPDRLLYQFRVEDPKTWSQPWGGEYEFAKAVGLYEYACHEGNYGLEGILAGARQEERNAASGGRDTAAR